jgi:hypothetical protein
VRERPNGPDGLMVFCNRTGLESYYCLGEKQFEGTAAITGDFVLIASEVNPVLRALRENGIEVTAVHNHMLDDQPRLFFMHCWANDDAAKLARGLKAALDKMNLANS